MKQDPKFQPTPSELAILHILWSRGPSTVREIHDELAKEKDVGYTSALKFLQIMTAKGLVTRTEEQRAHVYSAQQPAEKTKQQFAADVLKRVFHGSASQLMQHALSGRRGSKKEIEEMRRMLDEYERKLP
ncbi:MAG TPA: BlaI/MecI/CopY family transcriptional regulator [Steroidobacteraceae bacterium]|jgi:predicted transcriptional regulator|nr:BlaI/MecI/CopY family transcriptional regulator [Steroidobacteraceae bacterium]